MTFADMPSNWEDCSRAELRWLAEHGSYGQRLIANRWLHSLPPDTDTDRADMKLQGPPLLGSIADQNAA